MKIRTVLGEYWLAASWMATSVVANAARDKRQGGGRDGPAKVTSRPG